MFKTGTSSARFYLVVYYSGCMKNSPANGFDIVIDTPVGRAGISVCEGAVSGLAFVSRRTRLKSARQVSGITRQLARFFTDPGFRFTVKTQLEGTVFQQSVWRALIRIKPGTVLTYGQLAERLGSGARAVGNACRANPVPLIIPCHRVVAASGIGGYAGQVDGPEIRRKRWLLAHEGIDLSALN